MLSDIVRRIEKRLLATGQSATAASLGAGLTRDTIRDLKRSVDGRLPRRTGLGAETAARLAAQLGTTTAWLLRGEGPETPGDTPETLHIPVISWVAASQWNHLPDSAETGEWPIICTSGLPRGDYYALEVIGDSMDKIAPEGSIIIVRSQDRDLQPRRCYVIGKGSATSFKRWRASGVFEPVSTNDGHEPIVPDSTTRVLGRVVRVIADL